MAENPLPGHLASDLRPAARSAPVVTVEGLRCATPSGRVLFEGLGLDVRAGGSAAVTGASGCGKSTLLMCLLGLVRPEAGRITVAGHDLGRMRARERARYRRENVGMVFQSGELLPELDPLENVVLAALLAGARPASARRRAARLLDGLGIAVAQRATPTVELSGGERQRVAVARALVNRPLLLLADEPTGALDTATRDQVAELLFSLPAAQGCALVVVTHDAAVAGRADQRLVLAGPAPGQARETVGAAAPSSAALGEPAAPVRVRAGGRRRL